LQTEKKDLLNESVIKLSDLPRNRNLEISTAPTKVKSRNQLIHRRLSQTKPIHSGSDPESPEGRQSDIYGG